MPVGNLQVVRPADDTAVLECVELVKRAGKEFVENRREIVVPRAKRPGGVRLLLDHVHALALVFLLPAFGVLSVVRHAFLPELRAGLTIETQDPDLESYSPDPADVRHDEGAVFVRRLKRSGDVRSGGVPCLGARRRLTAGTYGIGLRHTQRLWPVALRYWNSTNSHPPAAMALYFVVWCSWGQ